MKDDNLFDFACSETFRGYELEINYGDAYANREMPIERDLPSSYQEYKFSKGYKGGEVGRGPSPRGEGGWEGRGTREMDKKFIKRGEFLYLLRKLNEHLDEHKKPARKGKSIWANLGTKDVKV